MKSTKDTRQIPSKPIIDKKSGQTYIPKECIGGGGMGLAFTAERGDELVLLKEFFPKTRYYRDSLTDRVVCDHSANHEELLERFKNEFYVGKEAGENLFHAVTADNYFETDNGNHYLVMKYEKHGVSLMRLLNWLRDNHTYIGMRAWAKCFQKLAETVETMHSNGILHADISPSNIMICTDCPTDSVFEKVIFHRITSGNTSDDSQHEDYAVLLLDFGCAYGSDETYYDENDNLWVEKRKPVLSTEGFASEELLDDRYITITPHTDIYSMCACLKFCAVSLGQAGYIYNEDLPVTVKAQFENILLRGMKCHGTSTPEIRSAKELSDELGELIHRIDGNGISKAVLWENGRTQLKDIRFAIEEGILPYGMRSGDNKTEKLEDILNASHHHMFLYGEGGIGKTTSMLHYAKSFYSREYTENAVVPLYIDLGSCIMAHADKSSHLIYRRIISLLTGVTLEAINNGQISELGKLFGKKREKNQPPEYILLLDGLNEVSDKKSIATDGSADSPIATLLIQEIQHIVNKYHNVRIILSSRKDSGAFDEKSVDHVEISGLDENSLMNYLRHANISVNKKMAVQMNPQLKAVLKVPLFLTLYTTISDTDKISDISTRGEILRAFFYTQINRIKQLNLPLGSEQYAFLLNYVIPNICAAMADRKTLELDENEMCELIKNALDNNNPIYAGFPVRSEIRKAAKAFQNEWESDEGDNRIIYAICDVLGLFYVASHDNVTCVDRLKITHQHYRDYFAALHLVNLLKSAMSSVQIEKGTTDAAFDILLALRKKVISHDVLTLLGEFLGEHKNTPALIDNRWVSQVPSLSEPQDRNLIERALTVFRGRFDGSVGYGVYHLIETLKTVRRDFSGIDLSLLDLSRCQLNGIRLSRPGCVSNLHGAKMASTTLFPIGHSDMILSVAYNPDGSRIITTSLDGTVKIFDSETFSLIRTLKEPHSAFQSAVYSPDGTMLLTSSSDKSAKIWNVETGELLKVFSDLGSVFYEGSITFIAAFSPDGKRLITAPNGSCILGGEDCIRIWDIRTGEYLFALPIQLLESISSVAYSPDGSRFVTVSERDGASIWKAASGKQLFKLTGHNKGVNSAAFSFDGTKIITASSDGTAKIWETKSGKLLQTLKGHKEGVTTATFSPDGNSIVTASHDGTAIIWNTVTGKREQILKEHNLKGHKPSIYSAAFSPDGSKILTVSGDGCVIEWDATIGSAINTLQSHTFDVSFASFSPDESSIITASGDWYGNDNAAKIWDTASGTLCMVLEPCTDRINTAMFSPDSKSIVTSSNDGTVKIWDIITGLPTNEVSTRRAVKSAMFSPDGSKIVAAVNVQATIFDFEKHSFVHLIGHSGLVYNAQFSPDGTKIITASGDHTVKVWDSETGELLMTFDTPDRIVNYASFSPEGNRIAIAFNGGDVLVRDITTHTQPILLDGRHYSSQFVSFSPDGKMIVATSQRNIILWNSIDGSLVSVLEGHTQWVNSAFFSRDCTKLVTASNDGTTKLWDVATKECLDTIPNIHGLTVMGCDLRELHPESELSEKEREWLRRYGAILG